MLFPAPLRPSRQTSYPRSIARLARSRMGGPPKAMLTSCMPRRAMISGRWEAESRNAYYDIRVSKVTQLHADRFPRLRMSSPSHRAAEPAPIAPDNRPAIRDLEGFFEVALDMFCMLDFDGYFKRLNPAWERTLGFTREELMSRKFIEFVHPDDRERTLNQNAEVRGGGQARGFENRYLTKDGSFRWLLWNATPFSHERVIYSMARDITERKQAEEEKARLMAELEATLAEVKTLRAILPICSYCRKVRDDEDYWQTVETYIARHTNSQFSHSICPDCMHSIVEPELRKVEGRKIGGA